MLLKHVDGRSEVAEGVDKTKRSQLRGVHRAQERVASQSFTIRDQVIDHVAQVYHCVENDSGQEHEEQVGDAHRHCIATGGKECVVVRRAEHEAEDKAVLENTIRADSISERF